MQAFIYVYKEIIFGVFLPADNVAHENDSF